MEVNLTILEEKRQALRLTRKDFYTNIEKYCPRYYGHYIDGAQKDKDYFLERLATLRAKGDYTAQNAKYSYDESGALYCVGRKPGLLIPGTGIAIRRPIKVAMILVIAIFYGVGVFPFALTINLLITAIELLGKTAFLWQDKDPERNFMRRLKMGLRPFMWICNRILNGYK